MIERLSGNRLDGVELRRLPLIEESRGRLCFGEAERHLPFVPMRYFVIFDVPAGEVRGGHAHRTEQEFIVCVRGSCTVRVDDGRDRREFRLDSPTMGLYIPPLLWSIQYEYSADALLLVFSSIYYNADDYIQDYQDYLAVVRQS